jgi:hypothetical protein
VPALLRAVVDDLEQPEQSESHSRSVRAASSARFTGIGAAAMLGVVAIALGGATVRASGRGPAQTTS